MPETGPRFVWRIVGEGRDYPPPEPIPKRGVTPPRYGLDAECWLCGGETDGGGWPRDAAIPETFTNHNKAARPASSTVCQPCAALARKATWEDYVAAHPDMGLKTGHAMSWRFYSHAAWDDHHECPQSPRWRDLLLDPPPPPFVYVMSTSGQKHLLFRSLIAHDRDLYPLRVEEDLVLVDRLRFADCLCAFEALLALGHSRDEVASGRYNSTRVLRAGLRAHADAEWAMRPWRDLEPAYVAICARVARREETA